MKYDMLGFLLAIGALVCGVIFITVHSETVKAGLPTSYRYVADFSCPTGWDKDMKTWHRRISYVSGFKDNMPVCTELEISTMGQGLAWQEQTSEDGRIIYITIERVETKK